MIRALASGMIGSSSPARIKAVTGAVDGAFIKGNTASSNDWPTIGLDYAETRFSKLKQITSDNVKGLGLVWSYSLDSVRGIEATPLVVDGIMYQTGPWSVVYAIDARNGTKIWTSNAHNADYLIALFRTSPPTKGNRRHGLTQFLVDMKTPGITTRPIINLTGGHDFNEVVFDDAFLPDSHLIGEVDMAWKQATDELAYERSGPDRWIETFPCLVELVRLAGEEPSERLA